ncbi:MAG: hypothetical protein Q9160_007436 [Pyrenula sp. 1 TL-2023]
MAEKGQRGVAENRQRLTSHFTQYQGVNYLDGWERLWSEKSFLPWDRGLPNPALDEVLSQRIELIGHPVEHDGGSTRKRALVPGCGRGVDVLLLSSFGYDAIGLECSPSAVDECRRLQQERIQDYPVRDAKVGRGQIQFLVGDFFKDDWRENLGYLGTFDLIYDYTVSGGNP